MHTVVERELELKLVLSPERSIPVPARLTLPHGRPVRRPHRLPHRLRPPVNWTFARELLVEGVFRPCGHGDVRIWPTKVDDRSVICMALSSPDGDALLEAPSAAVPAWLERTLRVVPPGTESDQLGIDDGAGRAARPDRRRDDLWLRDPWPSDESPDQDGEA